MHIVVATVGTRGDVQPYLALAKALVARGHRVSFATHEDHGPLVASHGFELRATAGNFRELMATPAGRAWLDSSDSVSRYVKTLSDLFDGTLSRVISAGTMAFSNVGYLPWASARPFAAARGPRPARGLVETKSRHYGS